MVYVLASAIVERTVGLELICSRICRASLKLLFSMSPRRFNSTPMRALGLKTFKGDKNMRLEGLEMKSNE